MNYLLFAARCVLGLVFAVSAWTKLRDFPAFLGALTTMRVLPEALDRPMAALVVILEVAVPLLLLVTVTAPLGLALAAVLLIGFAAAISVTLARGTGAACACFGPASHPFGRRHLVRNALLAVLAGAGALVGVGQSAFPPVAGAVITAVGALVVALLMILFDEVAELVAGPVRR
jgi:uncharacterized membrane protein YphA (DoxX/SURF4 family)